jgi:hypothetical protein
MVGKMNVERLDQSQGTVAVRREDLRGGSSSSNKSNLHERLFDELGAGILVDG